MMCTHAGEERLRSSAVLASLPNWKIRIALVAFRCCRYQAPAMLSRWRLAAIEKHGGPADIQARADLYESRKGAVESSFKYVQRVAPHQQFIS